MRIGLFSDAYLPDINGVVSSIATLKDALEKLGHTVFVISNHKGAKVVYDAKEHILHLPGIEMKKMYGYKMSSPIQTAGEEFVRDMDLDIIHVHTEMGIGVFARQMAKKLDLPLVYTYHTLYEDYIHYVNPMDLPSVDKYGRKAVGFLSKVIGNSPMAVIAPSNKTKKVLMRYGVTTPIYVVPTGVDLSDFSRENLDENKIAGVRNHLGLSKDDHVVVFVGRIAKEKCIEMPIEAVSLSKDTKLHLVIVGSGTDLKYYQTLVDQYHVNHQVHFTGRVDKQDIPYYYTAFDCFTSASVSETQGMTYIEALASGLPVFGRRDEVLDGLIDEGKTGYYFDTPEELENKWVHYFSKSKAERDAMRPLCIKKTEAYHTDLFAHKILSVYQQAIDDYNMAYDVQKIDFHSDDFVTLTVKRKSEDESIKFQIPDDDFFELKISVHTILDAYTVSTYLSLQNFYKGLIKAKHRLMTGDYTAYEIKQYCMKKLELDEETSMSIVHNLEESNLIDDHQYALEKSLYWHSCGQNKKEIRKKLSKAGIQREWVDEAVNQLSEENEEMNAQVVAKRLIKGIQAQSNILKRQTLTNKLIRKGYSSEVAHRVGESIEWDDNEQEELLQAIAKAKRLYASKKDEKERLQKIRLYCMKRGFRSSQIDEALEAEYQND